MNGASVSAPGGVSLSGIVAAGPARYGREMGLDSTGYRPRTPEHGVLYTVVRAYLESFLRAATERTDGVGLPRFVEDEFRQFLTCGIHEHGVARLRCDGCGLDRLLPFSCKGEGSVRPAEAGG
jgi:hypothetical protein